MNRAEGHSKLSTSLCEVEDYYNSDSSSQSLKQAFQSGTKAESSKTIVMQVMGIGINNLEQKANDIKAMLERLVKESEEKEAYIKF